MLIESVTCPKTCGMGIRGQSSSPDPLLTLHFPGPQFSHLENDLLEVIFFEVDSRYGFYGSLLNLLFWWTLQAPIGTNREGETCLMSAQGTSPNISGCLQES